MGSRVLVQHYFCLWFSCLSLGMKKMCKPKLVAIVFVEGDSPRSKIDQRKDLSEVLRSL